MDEAEYPGIRISLTAHFDGTRTPLKVDISTGDIITPQEVRYPFKLMLEDRSIELWAYNIETVLAEKLETIISRATANTNMRDFYDTAILTELYADEINPTDLHDALNAAPFLFRKKCQKKMLKRKPHKRHKSTASSFYLL